MNGRTDTLSNTEFTLDDIEQYRRELTGYCYRMLGSAFEAEDAVQDTMVRAWKGIDKFEGRSSMRSWLYRIATNACLDMLRSRQRRARPMDMGPSSRVEAGMPATLADNLFVEPIPDVRVMSDHADPAEVAATRETIRLAFVSALQYLPARQRAVLILREVLRWEASEVAELLDTTVASVNSALQRARATLATRNLDEYESSSATPSMADEKQALLAQYVDAFERYDVSRLVTLLHHDAVMSMPPFPLWLVGPEEVANFFRGPGHECQGSRTIRTSANGAPAFAQYRIDPNGGFAPWAIHVLEIKGDKIASLNSFLDTRLFETFGMPAHLDG